MKNLLVPDRLIRPIPGKNAVGIDLRAELTAESLYLQAKDARNSARAMERRRMANEDASNILQAWRTLDELCQKILISQSKDLEVTAWLIEAQVRCNGFGGLAASFELARQLCKQYWCQLYPQADEEGIATTVAALAGLNGEQHAGTLIAPIANVPLTQAQNIGHFTTWQYRSALEANHISGAEKSQKRSDNDMLTRQNFSQAVRESEPEFIKKLLNDIQACQKNYRQLMAFLDEKCGENSPPSSAINTALEECEEVITRLQADISIPDPNESLSAESLVPARKNISQREQALDSLLKVAAYFKRTEPHSPIPYVIERAVRWANMSLPKLMAELITDQNTRTQLADLTGIHLVEEGNT